MTEYDAVFKERLQWLDGLFKERRSYDKNKGRVITCVFRIEDNDKFKPVWDSMRNESSEPLGAHVMCIAEGDRMKEMERELNVWQHFSDALINHHEFDEVWDDISAKQDWTNTDEWDIPRCVSEIAKVWEPEDY